MTIYPLYDAHGNMIADVSRSGSTYSLNDQRMYDVWGAVRSGSTTGDPKNRYCANLGHVQDDETDLIYMRARYYDFARGRFISEDPGRQRANWYSYCSNQPITAVDSTGSMSIYLQIGWWAGLLFATEAMALMKSGDLVGAISSAQFAVAAYSVAFMGDGFFAGSGNPLMSHAAGAMGFLMNGSIVKYLLASPPPWLRGVLSTICSGLNEGERMGGLAMVAVSAVFAYSLVLCGAMVAIDIESEE